MQVERTSRGENNDVFGAGGRGRNAHTTDTKMMTIIAKRSNITLCEIAVTSHVRACSGEGRRLVAAGPGPFYTSSRL